MHSALLRLSDILFPPRADELALRTVSIDKFLSQMSPVLVDYTRPATVALFSFSNPSVRAAIHEAKYHGSTYAFSLLGTALADYLHDCDDVGYRKSHICLVPVPLGKARQKERRFNQAHEIILCAIRSIGEEGVDKFALDTNILTRVRETKSQVSLPRHEREENMRGAFLCPSKLGERSRDTFIIIDDVITTGATLQAATLALMVAGAEHIIPLALAH